MDKLDRSGEEIVSTIVSAEEQLRGWLVQISRLRDPHRQIEAYERLQRPASRSSQLGVCCSGTPPRQIIFRDLRSQGARIGTMDLKIACIVLASDATLLSRNLGDFRKVPTLRVENWL